MVFDIIFSFFPKHYDSQGADNVLTEISLGHLKVLFPLHAQFSFSEWYTLVCYFTPLAALETHNVPKRWVAVKGMTVFGVEQWSSGAVRWGRGRAWAWGALRGTGSRWRTGAVGSWEQVWILFVEVCFGWSLDVRPHRMARFCVRWMWLWWCLTRSLYRKGSSQNASNKRTHKR